MWYESLEELYDAGNDLRVWCYQCARGAIANPAIYVRFAHLDPITARPKFRCKTCRSNEHVLLVPARAAVEPEKSWANRVVAFFHANRAAMKG